MIDYSEMVKTRIALLECQLKWAPERLKPKYIEIHLHMMQLLAAEFAAKLMMLERAIGLDQPVAVPEEVPSKLH